MLFVLILFGFKNGQKSSTMQVTYILQLVLLIAIATTASLTEVQGKKGFEKKMLYKRNLARQRGRGVRNRLSQSPFNQASWSMYVPQTPSPSEVECQIDVEVIHHVGGRCVRLGGQFRRAVCQSGMHLDIYSNDCQNILAQREMLEAAAEADILNTNVNDGGE